jgi:hypothetical protein
MQKKKIFYYKVQYWQKKIKIAKNAINKKSVIKITSNFIYLLPNGLRVVTHITSYLV